MSARGAVVAAVRLIHPAPALTVITLSAALGAILLTQSGQPLGWRLVLATLAVAGSQILTGALNDWTDRDRDRLAQPAKPIPSGVISPRAALMLAGAGALLQLAASFPLGALPSILGAVASASAVAYNLWLSRTPASVLPYLVSFGLLPLWVAAGVGVEPSRVAAAPILVGPFAAAAHLANTVRDFDVDARLGSRNLAQMLGRGRAFATAWALCLAVGLGVGVAMLVGGTARPLAIGLGVVGLAAVVQGIGGPRRLWFGIMVAAVCWTAAWALGTGAPRDAKSRPAAPGRCIGYYEAPIVSSSCIYKSSVSSVSFNQTNSPASTVSGMTIIAATMAAMLISRTRMAFMEISPS